jgi:hypothetical protein
MAFLGITVNFIIQKLKSKHLVCLSFLWWKIFLREREKIFCTYSGPNTPAEAKIIWDKNVRAWVSMVSYLKNFRKTMWEPFGTCLLNPVYFHPN